MMILLKSEMLDLLTDHLLLFEADLATLRFTWASRPLEVALGFDVQGELSGKLVESVLPGLLTPSWLAAPVLLTATAQSAVKRDGTALALASVLIAPRATTAGRVIVGIVAPT